MNKFRKVLIGTSFVLFATSFPPGLVDAAPSPDGPSPPTTAPNNASVQGGAQGGVQRDYAAVAYAKQKGVSKEVAAKHLLAIGAVTGYADQRRKDPDFAAFRVVDTPAGPEGQLAATSIKTKGFDAARNIRLVPAKIAESEFFQVSEKLTAAAQKAGVRDATAAVVDPFTDEITVWRQPVEMKADAPAQPPAPPVDAPHLRDPMRQAEPRLSSDAQVTVKVANSDGLARGGQKAISEKTFFFWKVNQGECTTGFGMHYTDPGGVLRGGYYSAGHCEYNNGWKINGNSVRTYWDRRVGGYVDRIIWEANGASWWVWNGLFNEDMSSVATHIYQGGFYCMYSRKKYGQQCGWIQRQNVVINTKYGQIFVSEGDANMRGIGGDSGGPVWQPMDGWEESRPAGQMESSDSNQGDLAGFLALDDQLATIGWRLL